MGEGFDGVDIDRVHYMRCTGPCNQGRKKCPTPESCECAVDEDGLAAARGICFAMMLSAFLALVSAVVWWLAQ
jgi:hypothetical protein